MEEQIEVQKQFREQQSKYVYYLIALAVTAIGFSIYKTTGLSLKWVQIPLGISVLSWGLSVYCGLTFLKYAISNLYSHNFYYDLLNGQFSEIGDNPELIKSALKSLKNAMESNGDKSNLLFKWQERLFYAGIVLFVLWHILEMYNYGKLSSP